MPPFSARLRARTGLLALASGVLLSFPSLASAEFKIRMDAQSGPAVVFIVGDSAADAVTIQRRAFDEDYDGDDPGTLGDPAGFTGSDIVEFRPKVEGAVLTQDGSYNALTANWCANVGVAPSEFRVVCAIDEDAEVTTTGTSLGGGDDKLELIPAEGDPEIDLIADGGAGADFLVGGAGDDTLTGGTDVDNIFSNAGNDTIEATDSLADGVLSCGADTDVINIDAADAPNGGECETVNTASNPVTLQFAFPATTRDEGGGQLIPVTEATPSTGSGSFSVDVVGGTATKGVDYSGEFDGQVIEYESGQMQYVFTLSTIQDTQHEGDETIELALNNETGDVEFGTPATLTLTINDDDPPVGGETPPPAPGPAPVVDPLPNPASIIPVVQTIEKRLPDFTRGGQFLIPACKKRGYCVLEDVVKWFALEGTSPDINPKYTSSINDAPDPKKVVQGEVVGSTPADGLRVSLPVGGTFPVEVQIFEPNIPKKEQKCKSTQKISAGADTTLGKYLVGKSLEETKKTLLQFDCFDRTGADEKNGDYAILTTTRPGTRYAEVERVSDERLDGDKDPTLVVRMRVPPSHLLLSVGGDGSKTGPGLAMSDGTLTVDPDTKTHLLVRVGLPATAAVAPIGTEVTLRDPDGQLVDRALTDVRGEARLSGLIPESKRYEIYASFADADGDSLAGSIQLNAKKRSGRVVNTSGQDIKIGNGGPSAKSATGTRGGKSSARRAQSSCETPTGPEYEDPGARAAAAAARSAFCFQLANKRADNWPKVFGVAVLSRITESAAVMGIFGDGRWDEAKKRGLELAWIASGNPSGSFNPAARPVFMTVPAVTTDGVTARVLPASVTDVSNGILVFRNLKQGVTITADGRILIEPGLITVSPERLLVERPALSALLKTPDFSLLPVKAGLPGLGLLANDGGSLIANDGGSLLANDGASIVAAGGGNVVAAGGGNIVAAGGGNLLANDDASIVAAGGGNVVAAGGGNIVAAGGGNVLAAGQ